MPQSYGEHVSSSRSARATVLASLLIFSILSYALRVNISVAQEYMVRDLKMNAVFFGMALSTFAVGYALFQVPSGMAADRMGPRVTLSAAVLGWVVMTFLTGLIPATSVWSPSVSLGLLLVPRFLLGVAEAGTYPISAKMIKNWFPPARHATVMAAVLTGAPFGVACILPLAANLTARIGWRQTFFLTALLPLPPLAWWWFRVTDQPQISNDSEPVKEGGLTNDMEMGWPMRLLRSVLHTLRKPDVLLLCGSYFFDSAVLSMLLYWPFKYLTDERKLTTISAGWTGSLPFLAATVMMPLMGFMTDRIGTARNRLDSRRLVAIICLLGSATLFMLCANLNQLLPAILALCFSVGLQFSAEATYWSTALQEGDENVAGITGAMNLAGSLGVVVCNAVVPWVQGAYGWRWVFTCGAMSAVFAALLWLPIRESAAAFRDSSGSRSGTQ